MSLEQISLISQIISAVAVIASLIFVGFQIHQNTQVARAQIREHIMSDWGSTAQVLTQNPKVFATGIAGAQEEYDALSNEDKFTFMTQAFIVFKHYENMFLQYKAGFLDEETWVAWSTHPLMYFHQRGIRNWWKERGIAFTPSFRAFLEASEAPAMLSQVDLFLRKPKEPPAKAGGGNAVA
jgi:hypothetical protein